MLIRLGEPFSKKGNEKTKTEKTKNWEIRKTGNMKPKKIGNKKGNRKHGCVGSPF
jgi:hypothetical protein